jgi:propanol-preferring alcohol dehydrogenase
VVAPEAFVYRIPAAFHDAEAAPLLCAGVVGYRALKLAGAAGPGRGGERSHGLRLGIFGFGASGHVALQAARASGCEVAVFTRDPEHRALALRLGASWAGSADEDPGAPLDAAVLFAPSGALVPKALERLGDGGTLALAGITLSAVPPLDYERHLFRERVLRSVTAATREDAREFLALAASAGIRPEIEPFPLGAANHALQALKESRIAGAGVLTVG